MPEIQLLDEATIEKIAAGEVVERPSSVVKELVENAIDAKASSITVEIKEGGTTFLRITDNGCGIEKEQVRLAFLRHSTSKIRSLEDLLSVKSLGFRGEALASISAVSQVELITKTRGALTGVRYVVEGSKEKLYEEIGAPEGTTFLVRNLFFNTPVRRKFLKSAQTEGGYIATLVEHLALSHPEISFQLIVNNQPKLHTSGNCNEKDMIYHIYGKEIASNLIPVDEECEGIHIKGFLGKPVISRGNRNFENYYINDRYMKSNVIAKAIEEAYRPYLMNHQYPFCVLHIAIDEELVDVNVHPTKMEVRFSDGPKLYEILCRILRDAIAKKDLIPSVTPGTEIKKPKESPVERSPQPFEQNRIRQIREVRAVVRADSPYEKKYAPRPIEPVQYEPNRPNEAETVAKAPKVSEAVNTYETKQKTSYEQLSFLDHVRRKDIRIIGQLFDTYWLVECEKELFIIDQHAAHEKVLFERNMAKFKKQEFTSQQLSPPVIISLTLEEQQKVRANQEMLEKLGFSISDFGGNEIALCALPDNLYGLDGKQLFMDLLDEIDDASRPMTEELVWDRVATASCKAAVKGNNRLSRAEIEELLQELLNLEQPYHCPHGRPTMISMSQTEIERKFKRIVN